MSDATPVEVTNVVETKPADGAPPVPPTVATTTATQSTSTTTGPPTQAPPPAIVADDAIRKELARSVIWSEAALIIVVLLLLFFFANSLPTGMLPFVTGIIGGIVGNKAAQTLLVLQYEFGSSSGSTSKGAVIEQKMLK